LRALFAASPVFQCASIVLAAGIQDDRDLLFTSVTPLTSFVLSPVFGGAMAARFRVSINAG
jgi:hypothetical protein